MTRFAILGASSQIAGDLARTLANDPGVHLSLFGRVPGALLQSGVGPARIEALHYEHFPAGVYDVVMNFVGAGDPVKVAAIGEDIHALTRFYDDMAIAYLRQAPHARYLFMSSGAVYGGPFTTPGDEQLHPLGPGEHYARAKRAAEERHRALPDLAIFDIRVFNYFSRSQDLGARFFMSDVVRALKGKETLTANATPMVRDFLHPRDFEAMVRCLASAPPGNAAVDCYTRAPVEKVALLDAFAARFGLHYRIAPTETVNATGVKPHYYSTNRAAAAYGYTPTLTSLDGLMMETEALIDPSSR